MSLRRVWRLLQNYNRPQKVRAKQRSLKVPSIYLENVCCTWQYIQAQNMFETLGTNFSKPCQTLSLFLMRLERPTESSEEV